MAADCLSSLAVGVEEWRGAAAPPVRVHTEAREACRAGEADPRGVLACCDAGASALRALRVETSNSLEMQIFSKTCIL